MADSRHQAKKEIASLIALVRYSKVSCKPNDISFSRLNLLQPSCILRRSSSRCCWCLQHHHPYLCSTIVCLLSPSHRLLLHTSHHHGHSRSRNRNIGLQLSLSSRSAQFPLFPGQVYLNHSARSRHLSFLLFTPSARMSGAVLKNWFCLPERHILVRGTFLRTKLPNSFNAIKVDKILGVTQKLPLAFTQIL